MPGELEVEAIAYSQPDSKGSSSYFISTTIWVGSPQYRVAAAQPAPEAQPAVLRVTPNPFPDRTSLTFTAGEDGPATVEVYNAQGVPVARLFEGNLEKGKAYAWEFDGTHLPAGMYVARLRAGRQVLHQRLVLNK